MGEAVDVVFEIGHKASTLKEKIDDYTHKWNIFVRSGSENQQLDKFVQKVVFNLHETFDTPTRTCESLPYCVKEYGYGEFELPIDIYFKDTDEKYRVNYFLELTKLNTTQPMSRLRREMVTFINPSAEFRHHLIEGGALVKPLNSKANAKVLMSSSTSTSSIISSPASSSGQTSSILNDSSSKKKPTSTSKIQPGVYNSKIAANSFILTSSSVNSSFSNIKNEKKIKKVYFLI
jgi:hypothetical protein